MRADNGVPAVHVVFLVEVMHGTAEAAGAAGRFAEKLGHAGISGSSARQRMGMIAISGDQVVVRPRRCDRADHDRFLPDVEMAEAADLLRLILLTGAFLETPDQQHQREHLDFVALLRRLHGRFTQRETKPRRRANVPGCVRSSCRERRAR